MDTAREFRDKLEKLLADAEADHLPERASILREVVKLAESLQESESLLSICL